MRRENVATSEDILAVGSGWLGSASSPPPGSLSLGLAYRSTPATPPLSRGHPEQRNLCWLAVRVRLTFRAGHVKTESTLRARSLPAGRFTLLPRGHIAWTPPNPPPRTRSRLLTPARRRCPAGTSAICPTLRGSRGKTGLRCSVPDCSRGSRNFALIMLNVRFDVAPLVVMAQEFVAAEVEVVEHPAPQTAALSGVSRLERDERHAPVRSIAS